MELGITVDPARTAARARGLGKEGVVLERIELAREAARGEIDVPLALSSDRERGVAFFESIKATEDLAPVSAKLDLDKHATIPEKNGAYVDVDAVLARVESFAGSVDHLRDARIDLVFVAVPPRVSRAYVDSLDIGTVVSEFETHFSRGGDQARRGKNIDVASSKLEGLILSPGQQVSFNEIVGERSEAKGFQKSWEIFKGEMVEGVGGGTCQVASTFHAAVLFGGLDVLERLPHSRPSAYIPMGLDSTVVYPGVDLKVRNPHPFPVVVHAKTTGNTLRIELLGKEKPVKVSFGREVLATIAYKRKVVEEAGLPGNRVVVKQHGIRGYRVKRSRQLTYSDGTHRTETSTDFYPPTTEIYLVPAGFDVDRLPPLPAGAEGDEPAPRPKLDTSGAVACAGDCAKPLADEPPKAPPGDIEFVDARGVHAPSAGQIAPPKSVWVSH